MNRPQAYMGPLRPELPLSALSILEDRQYRVLEY